MGWPGPMTHRQFLAWRRHLGFKALPVARPNDPHGPPKPLTKEQVVEMKRIMRQHQIDNAGKPKVAPGRQPWPRAKDLRREENERKSGDAE